MRWQRWAANAIVAALAVLAMTLAAPATAHAASHASPIPTGTWGTPTPHAVIADRLQRTVAASHLSRDTASAAVATGIDMPRDDGRAQGGTASSDTAHDLLAAISAAPRGPPTR